MSVTEKMEALARAHMAKLTDAEAKGGEVEAKVEVFKIIEAATDDPHQPGWYWHAADYLVGRGPFESEAEATSDAEALAKVLTSTSIAHYLSSETMHDFVEHVTAKERWRYSTV